MLNVILDQLILNGRAKTKLAIEFFTIRKSDRSDRN